MVRSAAWPDGHHQARSRHERPERRDREPRRSLTRDQVVDAAVRLLDAEGYQALSMRRVAQELGVGTMSIYWHVADRDELLDLVVDRVVSTQLLDEVPADWRTALSMIAHGALRMYEENPWILDAGPRPTLGEVILEHVEQSIAATSGMGLPFSERMAAVAVLDDYVLGYVLNRHVRGGPDGPPPLSPTARARVDSGDFPFYAEAVSSPGAQEEYEAAQGFEAGLTIVLDGIAAAVASGRMSPGAGPGATSACAGARRAGRRSP